MADTGRRAASEPEVPEEEKHGFGRKLLGLFVEQNHKDGEPSEAKPDPELSPAEQVAALAKASAPPPSSSGSPAPTASAEGPGGRPIPPASYKTPDFSGIFKSGGMSDEDRDRLAKAEDLLRNLPAETPAPLKRQIVEGTLRTFGIPMEKLSASALRAADALDAYLGISDQDLQARSDAAQKRLRELQAEEQKLQQALAERRQLQSTLVFDVRARQAELRAVVSFFGPPPAPAVRK